MTIDSLILEKIVKLRALAKSDNPHEAQAAARAAARLIQAYRLSEDEVEMAAARANVTLITNEDAGVWAKGKATPTWRMLLANVLADHFGCVSFHSTNRLTLEKAMRFAGRVGDVSACIYFHAWLSGAFRRAAMGVDRQARRSFLIGCVRGLEESLRADLGHHGGGASTALVAINKERQAEAEAALGPMSTKKAKVRVDGASLEAGKVEGRRHGALARPIDSKPQGQTLHLPIA